MRQSFRNQQINKQNKTIKLECKPTNKCGKSNNDRKQEEREQTPRENNTETNDKHKENVLYDKYTQNIKTHTTDNENGIENKSSTHSNESENVNGRTEFDDNTLNAESPDIKEMVPQTKAEDESTSDKYESQNDSINGNIESKVGIRLSQNKHKEEEKVVEEAKFDEANKRTLNVNNSDRIYMPRENKVDDESSSILPHQLDSDEEEINGNVSNNNDTTNGSVVNTSDNEISKRYTEEDEVNDETYKSNMAVLEDKVEDDNNSKYYQNEETINESENVALLRNDTKQEPTAAISDLDVDGEITERINQSSSIVLSEEHPVLAECNADNIVVPNKQNKGRQAEANTDSYDTDVCLHVCAIDGSTL